MPVGVCAPPDPDASACEGRNLSWYTPRCPLRLTPSSPLRHERAAVVAEKSAERPPLGYLLATHGVEARDPAGHGAVSAGNRGCRQPGAQTPCHLSLCGLTTPCPGLDGSGTFGARALHFQTAATAASAACGLGGAGSTVEGAASRSLFPWTFPYSGFASAPGNDRPEAALQPARSAVEAGSPPPRAALSINMSTTQPHGRALCFS